MFVTRKVNNKLVNLEEVVKLGEAVTDQNQIQIDDYLEQEEDEMETENMPLLNQVRNTDTEESTSSC